MPSRPVLLPNRTAKFPTTASPTQYETVGRQDAAAEYIDERVVGKTLVENDLSADSRDSDGITVTRYSRDHIRS